MSRKQYRGEEAEILSPAEEKFYADRARRDNRPQPQCAGACIVNTDTHSPLPWTTERDGTLVIGGEVQLPIGPDRNRAEQRANAALIVRAVNAHQQLVDALTVATDALEGVIPWAALANPIASEAGTLASDMIHANAALHIGCAALRLAKGEGQGG